ncbi:MAG: cytochrome P460 family protein [Candidatus Thiodiazotropha sp. (ex Cardiolucina cf. quadrata)]|nr:cytochrome P460 family protein [Candidatus Thiodiazotropha sp. (ex Cardiolucina cf. quadrata)]
MINRSLLTAILMLSGSSYGADLIDYPDGYRLWPHVKSMTIHKGHPLQNPFLGIHHIYANNQALEGLKKNRFDEGAMLVFDQLKSNDVGMASVEGKRVLIGVMVKDSKRFPKTNGWGYEGWSGDSRTDRLVTDEGMSCHSCHTQQKDHDYVFTKWRD